MILKKLCRVKLGIKHFWKIARKIYPFLILKNLSEHPE